MRHMVIYVYTLNICSAYHSLKAASDAEEPLPSADQAQVSDATVLTVVSMDEESQEGETLRNGEAIAGNKDETKGAQEEREEGDETVQTSYIGTVEENEEEEEEEAVVVVQEKLGEASVTFEQVRRCKVISMTMC